MELEISPPDDIETSGELEISPPESFESPKREPYATPEELVSLFGLREITELSNHGDGCDLDRAAIERAIEYAESEVNSYIGVRYPAPLKSPVPQIVMMVVGDIVRYRLTSGDITEKDPITERYKRAIAWLKDVAAGIAELPDQEDGEGAGTGSVFIESGRRDWGASWPV